MREGGDDVSRRKRRWEREAARAFLAVGRFLLWLISWDVGPGPLEGPVTA